MTMDYFVILWSAGLEIPTILLFTLETNGTLKTATIFDYESNASTYSIRVQVSDEFNASMEGNFTVTLENANEAPFNLHNTGPLTMAENAPINTVVGNFNASDPDIGDGIDLFPGQWSNYSGDGDNSLFFSWKPIWED